MRKAEGAEVEPGDVVQITPETGSVFGACFLVVKEVKCWGVVGCVLAPEERGKPPFLYWYRAPWHEIEIVGTANWLPTSVMQTRDV